MRNRLIPRLLLTVLLAAPLLAAGCSAAPHDPATIEYGQDRWKS